MFFMQLHQSRIFRLAPQQKRPLYLDRIQTEKKPQFWSSVFRTWRVDAAIHEWAGVDDKNVILQQTSYFRVGMTTETLQTMAIDEKEPTK